VRVVMMNKEALLLNKEVVLLVWCLSSALEPLILVDSNSLHGVLHPLPLTLLASGFMHVSIGLSALLPCCMSCSLVPWHCGLITVHGCSNMQGQGHNHVYYFFAYIYLCVDLVHKLS
jgi:hypothetical protein